MFRSKDGTGCSMLDVGGGGGVDRRRGNGLPGGRGRRDVSCVKGDTTEV